MPCCSYERRADATSLHENVDSERWGCAITRNCVEWFVARRPLIRHMPATKHETYNSSIAAL